MRVRPIPKSWLIHEIVYEEFLGKDDWGKIQYEEPITIEYVRVDESTVFSRDSRETKIQANAVIFVDAVNSKPAVEFKEQSRLKFNGKDYTIKKVIPCYQPKINEIHHWELEVI